MKKLGLTLIKFNGNSGKFSSYFLFITIIKRRIFFFFILWNILIKCKKKCILSDTTENYNIHIVWNVAYTEHQKQNNTNKQTKFFGKWNWLIKIQKNYCITPGKGFIILFFFHISGCWNFAQTRETVITNNCHDNLST